MYCLKYIMPSKTIVGKLADLNGALNISKRFSDYMLENGAVSEPAQNHALSVEATQLVGW